MSSFNEKIDQVYAVLSSVNTRHHASTRAIAELNIEIEAISGRINQLTEQVNELVLDTQRKQEEVRQITAQYIEWRKQVQTMQADIHLIFQHLDRGIADVVDNEKEV